MFSLRARPLPLAVAALVGSGAVVAASGAAADGAGGRSQRPGPRPGAQVDPPALAALEARSGARIGVYAVDTGSGRTVVHRADERFPFASTGKILSAGLTLRTASEAELNAVVRWSQADVLAYAPITDSYVSSGLPLRHLLNAELVWSDNTAANLVVRSLGGPAAVQAALRKLGDRTTRVDRLEPELNTAVPGDERDTTTPRQVATDLRRFALGDLLTPERRALMRTLMETTTTGDALIRSAVPAGWTVADKTGSADYGTRNDVAVVQPPHRAPIVIAVDTTHDRSDAKTDDATVAAATRTALDALGVR